MMLRFLYNTLPGNLLLQLLTRPGFTRLGGMFLNSRLSALLIPSFIRRNHIPMEEYPPAFYTSFNDFFTRKIRRACRPIEQDPRRLAAPCDSRLTVIPITSSSHFAVKGVSYTLEQLLKNRSLAEHYENGWLLLFRLTVSDYHHYCFPADALVGRHRVIPGVFHTVNPLAAASRAIYRENTREYTLLSTREFGILVMMEVGAMLVGRISNLSCPSRVKRGAEKGMFEFGGSTIILLVSRDRLDPDPRFLDNSARGVETVVKMGEGIGTVPTPS